MDLLLESNHKPTEEWSISNVGVEKNFKVPYICTYVHMCVVENKGMKSKKRKQTNADQSKAGATL